MNNLHAAVSIPGVESVSTPQITPYDRGYARGVADAEARLEWRRSTAELLRQVANFIFWLLVLAILIVMGMRHAHEAGRVEGIKKAQEAVERGGSLNGSVR